MASAECAIVGFGSRASSVLLPALRRVELNISSIIDTDPNVIDALVVGRRQLGLKATELTTHLDIGRLPDIVVVATPHSSHYSLAMAVVRTSRFALIEKPLCFTSHEARLLAAHSNLLHVLVERPYLPEMTWVRRSLEKIGKLQRYEATYSRPLESYGASWRNDPYQSGGGVLIDMGYHLVDLALRLFGPIQNILNQNVDRRPGYRVEEKVHAEVRHLSGVVGKLSLSRMGARAEERIRVSGSKGTLIVGRTKARLETAKGSEHVSCTRDPIERATHSIRVALERRAVTISHQFVDIATVEAIERAYANRRVLEDS